MKKEELRIGNFIVSKMAGIINVQFIPVNIDMDNYEPIPLTEEWLLKFCFINQNYGWDLKDCGLFDHNYKNGKSLRLMLNASEIPINEIKFVHQLQNLYFALTGTELTYEIES